MRSCHACGQPLRPAARFCPACGAPTDEEVARRRADAGARADGTARSVQAISIVAGGTLLAVLADLGCSLLWPGRASDLVLYLLLVPVAGLAVHRLGAGGLRASLAGRPSPGWVALGALLGLPVIALGLAYVRWQGALLGNEGSDLALEGSRVWLLLTFALLPAVTEELLDRGVLWEASRRILSPGRTLLLTAALFTIGHGLQGGYLVYPHRFVAGLVFGWLRLRSGSVLPPIAAHLTCNGTWVLLATG